MTHEFELRAAVPIQAHLGFQVLSARYEVLWPNGSTIGLHLVAVDGTPQRLLRAFHHDGHWCVFRLDTVLPRIGADFAVYPERDQPGLVLYGLRGAFHGAPDLLAALAPHLLARWPGSPRAAGVRPPNPHHRPAAPVRRVEVAA